LNRLAATGFVICEHPESADVKLTGVASANLGGIGISAAVRLVARDGRILWADETTVHGIGHASSRAADRIAISLIGFIGRAESGTQNDSDFGEQRAEEPKHDNSESTKTITDVVLLLPGTLTKWRKRLGDKVETDEPLFEIHSNNSRSEICSPAAGIIAEILIEEGLQVRVNAVVARIVSGS
jgi:hypothetical protein